MYASLAWAWLEEVWFGKVQLFSHEYQQCDMLTVRLTDWGISVSCAEHNQANRAGILRTTSLRFTNLIHTVNYENSNMSVIFLRSSSDCWFKWCQEWASYFKSTQTSLTVKPNLLWPLFERQFTQWLLTFLDCCTLILRNDILKLFTDWMCRELRAVQSKSDSSAFKVFLFLNGLPGLL